MVLNLEHPLRIYRKIGYVHPVAQVKIYLINSIKDEHSAFNNYIF